MTSRPIHNITIYTYNISSHFLISKISVQWPGRENIIHPRGVRGVYSIINVDSLIYYDKKMNCVYYGTPLKLSLCLNAGQLIQFYVSIRRLKIDRYPLNTEKKIRRLSNFSKNIATEWYISPALIKIYFRYPWFLTSYMELVQVCYHRSLILFRWGVHTYSVGRNVVDS